jgi:hypothetical protein
MIKSLNLKVKWYYSILMNQQSFKYLSKIFDGDRRIQCCEPFSGNDNLVEVGMEIQSLGDLYLPSGQLVACDALGSVDGYEAFTITVPPGKYPVTINASTFNFIDQSGQERAQQVVAYSKVEFSKNLPVQWEVALQHGQQEAILTPGKFWGFGVDSGTACYMDAYVAKYVNEVCSKDSQKDIELFGKIEDLLNVNYQLNYSWANSRILEAEGGSIVAFSSGWGDGGYPSYFGLDEFNSPLCLATHFFVENWETTQ